LYNTPTNQFIKYSAKTNISTPRVYRKQTVQHINANSPFLTHTHKKRGPVYIPDETLEDGTEVYTVEMTKSARVDLDLHHDLNAY
jgi:hypothetical protein